ncbi:MAG: acylphosphatase [Rhodocyclaceae bacterium]|nr:acylphosphatase [Rhodocyclaceae bacterium]
MSREVRHLFVSGRVQGVGFRASMAREARRLGVTGWVRNLHDGRVEAMIQGSPEQLAAMLTWVRQGPPRAHVAHVDVELGSGEFEGFEQWPTV